MANFPEVNGHLFSFASVELKVHDRVFLGISAVDYSDKLEGTAVYGPSPVPLGRTRGKWSGEASVTFYQGQFQELIDFMGDGWGETPVTITVQCREVNMPVQTDVLRDVRFMEAKNSQKEGNEPNTVEVPLSLLRPILRNGKAIVRTP